MAEENEGEGRIIAYYPSYRSKDQKGVTMNDNIQKPLLTEKRPLQYEASQVLAATAALEKYMTLMQNNNRLLESGIHVSLTGEYNDVSLKRTCLENSEAIDASFMNTALTGSYFSEMNFRSSKFDESNMQYCQFVHSTFQNVTIHSTNLSYSNFFATDFKDVHFKGSTVSEILFEQCTFEGCTFVSSMLESAIFMNCTFIGVKFLNSNVEYMELNNCKLNDVHLPMAQVPYIFGLFQSMMDVGNDIKLSADHMMVPLNEYKELKDDLVIYYTSIQEYFPLANIYLANTEWENAYDSICFGMERAIVQRNFRMLKFFCKQAKQKNVFPYQKLKELYTLIEKYASAQKFNIYEQRSFIYNIEEIRSLLLENMDNYPTARISMQTNIDSSESDKIIRFIEYIDTIISESCERKISYIEYHHNSDAHFVVHISAHYLEIIFILYTFLTLSNNVIDAVQKKIINHQTILLNQDKLKKRKEASKKAQDKNEELRQNNINYTIQYIINNPVQDSHNINIYL
ncbi:hypothetical protein C807_02808 [Lachnospiraceae bacterium 28-4]|nr:hypothetical protein C807_02808 [Lachnospiraceae bacterium 28-4]